MSLPAPHLSPAAAAALAADLTALPYTTDVVETLLGPVATAALDREHAVAARRVVAGVLAAPGARDAAAASRPLAAVVGAFMLGDPVPAADLAAALPALGLDGAVEAGLVVLDGADTGAERARATGDLSP